MKRINYEKIKNEEEKVYKEITQLIGKRQGKSEKQIEKYKKYLFLKKIREQLYKRELNDEPYKFNYKK